MNDIPFDMDFVFLYRRSPTQVMDSVWEPGLDMYPTTHGGRAYGRGGIFFVLMF